MDYRPNIRAPIGIILILLLIFFYCLFVVWLFEPISSLPPLLQFPIWLILGIGWIFPARPLTVWIETGRWRAKR